MSYDPRQILAVRIAERLRDIPRHQAALDLAIGAFDGSFSVDAVERAMSSPEPSRLLLAYGVQSGFENLQNHIAGLARDGLEITGEIAATEPASTPRDLHHLARLGVITPKTCERLIVSQRLRNMLQHAYGELNPVDLHRAVVTLQSEVGPFILRYRHWLKTTLSGADT